MGKGEPGNVRHFNLNGQGSPGWVGQCLTNLMEGTGAGKVSGIRLFGQRVEQGKGLIVITSCVGEKNKRAT